MEGIGDQASYPKDLGQQARWEHMICAGCDEERSFTRAIGVHSETIGLGRGENHTDPHQN